MLKTIIFVKTKQKLQQMIMFDERGHLCPYEIIELNLEEFKAAFVLGMENKNRRNILLSKYLQFVDDLKKVFPKPFYQWIDGSFTTKKLFPGDIDVVSFIDYDEIARNAFAVRHFTKNGKALYEVDAHFAPTATWRHRFYDRTIIDEKYWKAVFGFSRENELFERHPKGIIKIKF